MENTNSVEVKPIGKPILRKETTRSKMEKIKSIMNDNEGIVISSTNQCKIRHIIEDKS